MIGAVRAIGGIGAIGRVAKCRDARVCLVRGRPFPLKVTMFSLYDDWVMRLALTQRTPSDLTRPCVPTLGYSSRRVTPILRLRQFLALCTFILTNVRKAEEQLAVWF